jgi:chaperone BCS1
MINELIEFGKSQPFLVGGVGTVFTSGVLYSIRSIPNAVYTKIKSSLISKLYVDSKNDHYISINNQIFKHRIPWSFRNYEPSESSGNEEKSSPNLIPGYGSGIGYWKGVFFTFDKSKDESQKENIKQINITFFTRNQGKISRFLLESTLLDIEDDIQRIYTSDGFQWNRMSNKKKRSLDSVFVKTESKEQIIGAIQKFINSENWYLERGIPYKFCILLSGKPGTGKTSLIHAVSSYFGRDIKYLTKLGNLEYLLSNSNFRPFIFVIEDIDTLAPSLKREEDEKFDDPPNHFHNLLNSLDGFTTPHGLITFITTNYPEKLDNAILRRIDFHLELDCLDFNAAREMFKAFYGQELTQLQGHEYVPVVGSKLQEFFLKNTAEQSIHLMRKS